MSEFTLNNFQKKTVDHIVDYFKEHNVYLLADETGIGKTVIASEVARRLTDNAKTPQSVLYIASNLDLANENIEKLKFEGSEVIRGRLSTLWKNFENEKSCDLPPIKLFAVTPSVSLRMSTDGTREERESCYNKYWDLRRNAGFEKTDIVKKMDIINGLILAEQKDLAEEKKTLGKTVISDRYTCILNEYKNASTQYLSKISEVGARKYKDISLSYDYDTDLELIAKECISLYIYDSIWKDNKSSEKDGILAGSTVQKIISENNDEDYVRRLTNISEKIGGKWEQIYAEIKDNKSVYPCLLSTLGELYWQEYYKLVRCYMAHYSLTQCVKPNVVIIDEIQNYPQIFSKENDLDEEATIIQSILEEVLGKGHEKNVKVLMLSATPYAYKNAIEIEDYDQDADEVEFFSKHLVGMEDILSYMKEQNNSSVDIIERWRNVQIKLNELTKVSKSQIDEEKFDEAKYEVDMLTSEMLELGISRSERPKKSFKPDEGKYTLERIDISELANYFVKGKKPFGTRLALSLPRDIMADSISQKGYKLFDSSVKKIGLTQKEWAKSSRAEALVEDLFEGNRYQFLFVPPNKPSHILEGVFKDSQRKHGKTLLFSAYNAVPECLQKYVEDRLFEKLVEASGWTKDVFEEQLQKLNALSFTNYMNSSNCNEDTISGLDEKEQELLFELFTSDYAKKVLLSIYKEKAVENYYACLDQYCIDGNLSAVMEEFNYMCSIQKSKPTTEELLKRAYVPDTEAFSVAFSSNMNDKFEEKIRAFNNPFYPFAFFITSMAEEGHDFHWYSDRIVHWNVPVSPISLIQREGRIDRADCMAVRKAIAEEMDTINCNNKMSWENLIKSFVETKSESIKSELYREMFPKFITSEKGNTIHRMCYYYPLSNEYFRWEILMKNLEFYRSMFGACDNDQLQELGRVLDNEQVWDKLKQLELDIHIR